MLWVREPNAVPLDAGLSVVRKKVRESERESERVRARERERERERERSESQRGTRPECSRHRA